VGRTLRNAVIAGGVIIIFLLFLLAAASSNPAFIHQYYAWLLGVNVAVAGALLLFIVVALWRLYARFKAGRFGSRLMTRLVILFAGIGILPGLVIFLVSVQFVSNSIDSWFNVKIEAALQSGVNLGLAALDQSLADLSASAEITATTLAGQDRRTTQDILNRMIAEREGVASAMLVSADGKILASAANESGRRFATDVPTAPMLLQAVMPGGYARTEGNEQSFDDPEGEADPAQDVATALTQRVVMAIPEPPGAQPLFLQVIQAVPVNLASNSLVLSTAFTEYQGQLLARVGLRRMYIETLTLTLLLAIFGAVASAFVIANKLAQPLLVLAEGTRAVAEGDLSPRPIVGTTDELGTLTQSFNAMTGQLFEARSSVERNRAALQSAKAHLESVLENMSAGVIVLDADFNLVTSNEAVERILHHSVAERIGSPLSKIDGVEAFAAAIARAFSAQSAQSAAGSARPVHHWQQQIEIPRRSPAGDEHDLTLLARGSRLPARAGSGYIVVFDDISDVISAQRSIAWGEVARRLAHEIKNPLTPIQLSAERMQMKLEAKLEGTDRDLLRRGTTTIVNQVDAMKRMVDDFRDYAKAPPAMLEELDLNALVEDILHMYMAGDDSDVIHVRLADGLPRVMGDPTQLRQVIHNLLQNAQDAMGERAADAPPARIDLSTEVIRYKGADGVDDMAVRLAIVDNGPGFSPKILSRAFEPYVTSKARGTGLGLPMVKKIIDEHGGRIEVRNRTDGPGAAISILLLKLCADSVLA
jgi:nitrogen fixation/metabolism regulation signal transduction histidine kinase